MKKLAVLLLLCHFALGWSHDDIPEQIRLLNEKIRKSPKSAELFFQRGELYRANGNWKEAEADYKTAKRLAPEMIAADLGLGLVYLQTGHLQESKAALDQFLQSHPDHAEARVARGHAYNRLHQIDAAIADYTQALKIRPDPEVYIERSRLVTSQGRLGEALEGLNEGIDRLGPIVTLELPAIEIEIQLARYDSALSRVDRIAAQSDRKETWLAKKGEILLKATRKEEALKAYESALEALRALPESRRSNQYTQELEKRIEAALQEIRQTRAE